MPPKSTPQEREYVIPLRKTCLKKPRYERTGKSVKVIKEFIAKHMRVPERDTSKVKLDVYLNNELWFKGRKKPPAKVKVKAKREGDIIKVSLAEFPEAVKHLKAKHLKIHKKTEKPKEEEKKEEEKTEEEKKEETEEKKEKAASAAEQKTKQAEQQAKVQKHTVKGKAPQIQRKALKK